MNKVAFEKGTKRKCASCSVMFYDFNKSPIICPSCGSEVSLLTNVTKRGRPSKASKAEAAAKETKDELVLDDIEVSDDAIVPEEDIGDDSENVESIIEIDKEKDKEEEGIWKKIKVIY